MQQQQQPPMMSSEPEVTSTLTEDGIVTDYRPPDSGKVKILKRPQSYPNKLSEQDSTSASKTTSTNKTNKSLKEREEEYAQARLRILGSAGHEDDDDDDDLNNEGDNDDNNQQQQKVKVVRSPKGPPTEATASAKGFNKANNNKKK